MVPKVTVSQVSGLIHKVLVTHAPTVTKCVFSGLLDKQ